MTRHTLGPAHQAGPSGARSRMTEQREGIGRHSPQGMTAPSEAR